MLPACVPRAAPFPSPSCAHGSARPSASVPSSLLMLLFGSLHFEIRFLDDEIGSTYILPVYGERATRKDDPGTGSIKLAP